MFSNWCFPRDSLLLDCCPLVEVCPSYIQTASPPTARRACAHRSKKHRVVRCLRSGRLVDLESRTSHTLLLCSLNPFKEIIYHYVLDGLQHSNIYIFSLDFAMSSVFWGPHELQMSTTNFLYPLSVWESIWVVCSCCSVELAVSLSPFAPPQGRQKTDFVSPIIEYLLRVLAFSFTAKLTVHAL